MWFFLSILVLSFLLHGGLLVPFINLLYRIKLQRKAQRTRDAFDLPTPIFDKYNKDKVGTPIGGGVLIIFNSTVIFLFALVLSYYFWIPLTSVYADKFSEVKILLFSFIAFGLVGLYDDIKKVFMRANGDFIGLRLRHKLFLEVFLSLILSFWLFSDLKISFIHIPFFGVLELGILYIFFSTFIITSFSNAFNITDGLDGLASGILMIALCAFWVISHSILDTPLTLFIAIWMGGLVAFLYFNVYPARIFLGDVGSLSFGATLAVIGLLLGKTFSLVVIGGFFVVEIFSSFLQLLSKRYRGKKLMRVAPLHLWLRDRGWHESTVVFRAWLVSVMLAMVGLLLAFFQ